MRPGIADLEAYRAYLEEELQGVLPDPRQAEWLATYATEKLKFLAGARIPSTSWFLRKAREAAADKVIHEGATIAAERLGCHRSTVYRRAHRHRNAA